MRTSVEPTQIGIVRSNLIKNVFNVLHPAMLMFMSQNDTATAVITLSRPHMATLIFCRNVSLQSPLRLKSRSRGMDHLPTKHKEERGDGY